MSGLDSLSHAFYTCHAYPDKARNTSTWHRCLHTGVPYTNPGLLESVVRQFCYGNTLNERSCIRMDQLTLAYVSVSDPLTTANFLTLDLTLRVGPSCSCTSFLQELLLSSPYTSYPVMPFIYADK